MQVHFTRSLKASAQQVERVPAPEFVRLLNSHWGSTTVQLYEWLAGNPLVRVYFDVDGKTPDTTAGDLMARCRAGLAAFFHDQPDFDIEADVMFATSHGGTKLSIRAYAPNHAMHVADIKKRIQALRLGNRDGGVFDEAVYGTRQKIRAPGAIKSPQDARVLDIVGDRESLPYYVIQEVPQDALRVPVPQAAASTRRTSRKPAEKRAAEAPPVDVDSASDDEGHSTPGFTRPDLPTATALLAAGGFRHVHFDVKNSRSRSLRFLADRARPCACCGHLHERNGWWCARQTDGRLYVRNYSARCKPLVLGESRLTVQPEEALAIQEQITGVLTDAGATISGMVTQLLGTDRRLLEDALEDRMDLTTLRHVTGDRFACACDAGAKYEFENIIQRCYSVTQVVPRNGGTTLVGASEAHLLRELMHMPSADGLYARWLAEDQRLRGVEWKADLDDHLYRSSGGLWERVPPTLIVSDFHNMAVAKLQLLLSICDARGADKQAKELAKGVRSVVKHVEQARSGSHMLVLARQTFLDVDFHTALNRATGTLGTPSGVLDLRTGHLLSGADRPPVSMSVRPRWLGLDTPTPDADAFFRSIFADDRETVAYVQRLFGAALTGEQLEAYVCLVGVGSNGKSVTLLWLRHVLKDYHLNADSYIFFADARHNNNATPALAALEYKRFAVVEESQPADPLNKAIVKRLTGTRVITARELYQGPRDIPLTHTQFLATNELPKIDVDDEAMMRRVIVVPFGVRFKKPEDFDAADPTQRLSDPTMGAFLQSDGASEQLLVWLVRGAVDFYAAGQRLLPKPSAIRQAEAAYTADNDPVGALIQEECDVGEGLRVVAEEFNARAQVRGAKRGVGTAMKRRGFERRSQKIDGRAGVHCYIGLGWKPEIPTGT